MTRHQRLSNFWPLKRKRIQELQHPLGLHLWAEAVEILNELNWFAYIGNPQVRSVSRLKHCGVNKHLYACDEKRNDNAGDIIDDAVGVQTNARQAAITQEISEIVQRRGQRFKVLGI